MSATDIEQITDKRFRITFENLNGIKFEIVLLRVEGNYQYFMLKSYDRLMFRYNINSNELEIYNDESECWENEEYFEQKANEFFRKYTKELMNNPEASLEVSC